MNVDIGANRPVLPEGRRDHAADPPSAPSIDRTFGQTRMGMWAWFDRRSKISSPTGPATRQVAGRARQAPRRIPRTSACG